jgi:hypothetical protein
MVCFYYFLMGTARAAFPSAREEALQPYANRCFCNTSRIFAIGTFCSLQNSP